MTIKIKGFTLVEIMIVVAIVALLVGVAIPNLLRVRINANQTSAQATVRSFASACETYAAANAALYPTEVTDLTTDTPPYFPFDPTAASREGYYFTVVFGDNSYMILATPLPNTGDWDYRATTGMILKRRKVGSGEEGWRVF